MVKYNEENADLNTFGGRLLYLMKKKNLTQKDLAEKIGVTERTVWRYVNNKSFPGFESINYISDALNVSTDYLLDSIKSKFPEESQYYEVCGIVRKNGEKWSEKQVNDLINILCRLL